MIKKIAPDPNWPEWKRLLSDTLTRKNINMREASLKAGLNETFVRDALKRGREPSRLNLERLSHALGVDLLSGSVPTKDVFKAINTPKGLRILGTVAAGAFMEASFQSDDDDNLDTIPIGPDERYKSASQYALAVSGDSMDRLFPHGSFVTCAKWADTGLAPRPGMVLHIERTRAGMVETTVKRLVDDGGKLVLRPESTNPIHRDIVFDGGETDEIAIRGLVTGSWLPLSY